MRRLALLLLVSAPHWACDAPSRREAAADRPATAPESVRWPALPADRAALSALVDAHTRRPAAPSPALSAEAVRQALERGVASGQAQGDFPAIAAELERRLLHHHDNQRVYLLFGSHHDAAGQIDAFRRLVGPLGIDPAPLSVVEQLQASSAWQGAPADAQAGDDRALEAWMQRGDRSDLEALLSTQRRRNYTAWKYRYVDRIADLLVAQQADRRPLIGCDMPRALRRMLDAELGREADVLRDLHCALAIERALAAAPRPAVAVFIGQAHLSADRLPRFLPAVAAVWRIHMLGERVSADVGVEASLGLRLTAPLLVPLGRGEDALLLDGGHLGIRVDRVRVAEPLDGDGGNVVVQNARGRVQIAGVAAEVDGQPWRTELAAGPKTFVMTPREGPAIAGAFELPQRGGVVLDFGEPDVLRLTFHDPSAR